jgi:hypothetical protein
MRTTQIFAACVLAVALGSPGVARAQGPQAVHFDAVPVQEATCLPPNCAGFETMRRRSRVGHAVLIGALIGASAALLVVPIAWGLCDSDNGCNGRAGRVALVVGGTVAVGALIGLIVGASEPSHGPVPTD